MRTILAIAMREIRSYFASPIAYVIGAAFLVVSGLLFAMVLLYSRQATMMYVFANMSVLLLTISPVLTMRLLAEEHRGGTIELLLTSPVRDFQVVLGKFIASLAFFAAMLAATLYYPVILFIYGSPEKGHMISGYLGTLLLGAAFLSIGLFASSLTSNQIVAAVLSYVMLLVLWLVGSAVGIATPPLSDLFRYMSIDNHYADFVTGVVDSRAVVYFCSMAAVFLFATVRSVEARRWR